MTMIFDDYTKRYLALESKYRSYFDGKNYSEDISQILDIIQRENELNKLFLDECQIDESEKFKEVIFANWFPTNLKEKMIYLASKNMLGRSFRLAPIDIINKYFSDTRLKSYWKLVNKKSQEIGGCELPWAIFIPLYCYILTNLDRNNINKLKNSEYFHKLKRAAKKAEDLVSLINELDCDLNLLYLYLQGSDALDLNITKLNQISEEYSNKIHLTDVLNFFATVTDLFSVNSKLILDKPNIKQAKTVHFVKILCKNFEKIYAAPFHEHSRDLVNVLFNQTLTKENIRSKTKNLRNNDLNINYINDHIKVKGEVMHGFLDNHFIGLYDQFYINPETVNNYSFSDSYVIKKAYERSRIMSDSYDSVFLDGDRCTEDWKKNIY